MANVRAGDSQTLRYLQGLRTHFNAQGADSRAQGSRRAWDGAAARRHARFCRSLFVDGRGVSADDPIPPRLQYAKRVPSQEAAANAEAAMLLSNTPEPWPDVLEHDAQVEDGDLVPQA